MHTVNRRFVWNLLVVFQSFGIAEGGLVEDLRNMAKAAGETCPDFTPPEGETQEQVSLLSPSHTPTPAVGLKLYYTLEPLDGPIDMHVRRLWVKVRLSSPWWGLRCITVCQHCCLCVGKREIQSLPGDNVPAYDG